MSERERILALRKDLRVILEQINAWTRVTAQDPTRCPYRSMEDLCTFKCGCQNKEAGYCSR